MLAMLSANAIRLGSSRNLPPLRSSMKSLICSALVARSGFFLVNPALSDSTNSPASLRPNMIAGLPSHLSVVASWPPFSILRRTSRARIAPSLPSSKIKSSRCAILASASFKTLSPTSLPRIGCGVSLPPGLDILGLGSFPRTLSPGFCLRLASIILKSLNLIVHPC